MVLAPDRDAPDVLGSSPDRPDVPGVAESGRSGGLFAAGWTLSKTWGRKSGPV